jgi:hypothetical protein
MVKFIDVDPNEIPMNREGRRGRVSYPILKSFMETGKHVAMLDRTGMQQSFQSLYSCLNSYIRNHDLPIKLFSRQSQLYLMRIDLDDDGNWIENWTPELAEMRATEGRIGTHRDMEPAELTSGEVERRFELEKGAVTK